MVFRIFTNDRGTRKGVKLYSALTDLPAPNQATAQAKAEDKYAGLGSVKAIHWPAKHQTADDLAWLAKHVG